MKTSLIITVAGIASRFSKSVGRECIKCLYYEDSEQNTLLHKMLAEAGGFDDIIIVGGYKFDLLEKSVKPDKKIHLVYNEHYYDYGSMYSLYLGVKKACELNADEVVFAEGDLFLNKGALEQIRKIDGNVITINADAITADKAVAFYQTAENRIKYIYDTAHELFVIDEPFKSIHNSGQVWKFKNAKLLCNINEALTLEEKKGTNLILIQNYFSAAVAPQLYKFDTWFNCNTVADYKAAKKMF